MENITTKSKGVRSIFDKIIEDKRAIAKSIKDGKSKETIERERDVRFVTPI